MAEPLLVIWTVLVLVMGWSYYWKTTVLFHFCEYTLIGVGVSHAFNIGFTFLVEKGLTPLIGGKVWYIIGFILGALVYTRFSKKYSYLMRYSMGFLAGTYIGLSIRGVVKASIISQITATIVPLFSLSGGDAVNHIIMIFMLVGVMWYFVFSKRLSFSPGPYKYVQIVGRIGIVIVMAFFLSNDFIREQQTAFTRVEFVLVDFVDVIKSFIGG